MDAVETEFFTSQYLQPFLWLRYIDDILFIWTQEEETLVQFLNELNNFHLNLSFTYETSNNNVNFLDLNVSLRDVQYILTFILNQQMVTNTSIISRPIPITLKCQYQTAKH